MSRRAAFLSILLSNVTTGIAGLLISTALLVVFAEIIPQSICSRHGLRLGAYTSWMIKFFMVVFLPVAWPLAFILDKVCTGLLLGRLLVMCFCLSVAGCPT